MATGGAEIQPDKNWAKIHNLILEALAGTALNGSEFRCLMFLFRKTYGHQKKEDSISFSQFSGSTGINRPNISRTLAGLIEKRIIYQIDNGNNRPKTYGFNKYVEQWKCKTVVETDNSLINESVAETDNSLVQTVIESDNKLLSKRITTKERKKAIAASPPPSNDSDDALALVRNAYHAVNDYPKSRETPRGKSDLTIASELIESYGWKNCVRAIGTLTERIQTGQTIRAPIPYLKTILSDFETVAPATLDISMEDVYEQRAY